MLRPNLQVKSIYDMDINSLKEKGIQALIFDLDNTLVAEETKHPTEKLKVFLKNLENNHIKVGVVSNNEKERVEIFMESMDIPYFYKSGKPSPEKVKKMMDVLNTDEKTTALVGDRLTTDILAGKRARVLTILVNPVGRDLDLKVKILRKLESLFLLIIK